MNALIERTAKIINLKEHTVGKKKVPLFGPGSPPFFLSEGFIILTQPLGDIEGHLGTDGKYYLLDFARTMPPEAPEWG